MSRPATPDSGSELSRADVVALQQRDPINRFELIDGELYVTPPEMLAHGRAIAALVGELHAYFKDHPGGSVAVGVAVESERERMVPDVAVFVPEDASGELPARPAIVAEVTSKVTRKRDMTAKTDAYGRAGVEEYWVLDPRARTLTIHECSDDRVIRKGPDEELTSSLLDGFCVKVSSLFP